jgi:hypothetical protein
VRNKIRVCAIDYKISIEDAPLLDGVKVDGTHSWAKEVMRVRKMGKQAMKQTLWHEIIHSLCAQSSINMKEADVDRLATGIVQVIRDNRWITK